MFRFLSVLLTAVCFLSINSSSVVARDYWQSFGKGNENTGAAICPVSNRASGRFFCLALSCEADTPLAFTISVGGGSLPGGTVPVVVYIDDMPAATLKMEYVNNPSMLQVGLNFDPDLHQDLIDQLSSGRMGEISIQKDEFELSQPFSLRKSSKAIKHAFKNCEIAEKVEIVEEIDDTFEGPLVDPVATVTKYYQNYCEANNATLQVLPDFETYSDLTGDGNEDITLDVSALYCDGTGGMICGTGGCQLLVFSQIDGYYHKILDAYALIWDFENDGLKPAISLALHGSACGLGGDETCYKRMSWDGQTLSTE